MPHGWEEPWWCVAEFRNIRSGRCHAEALGKILAKAHQGSHAFECKRCEACRKLAFLYKASAEPGGAEKAQLQITCKEFPQVESGEKVFNRLGGVAWAEEIILDFLKRGESSVWMACGEVKIGDRESEVLDSLLPVVRPQGHLGVLGFLKPLRCLGPVAGCDGEVGEIGFGQVVVGLGPARKAFFQRCLGLGEIEKAVGIEKLGVVDGLPGLAYTGKDFIEFSTGDRRIAAFQ